MKIKIYVKRLASYIFLVLIYSQTGFAQNSKILGLNDVSILLPLPESIEEMNLLLSPQSEMIPGQKHNELFPKSVYKLMPTLNVEIDQEKNYQNNLKVIGIRFDPCFREGFVPTACQPQIRLVWQPIYFKTNAQTGEEVANTMDTAVHTFYNLSSTEWSDLIFKLKEISSFDIYASLQIHPRLLKEGFDGAYWQGLKNIILTYAGKKNLVRTTVMISRNGFVWAFRGVDFSNGGWSAIEIPTMKAPAPSTEKIVNDAFFIEPAALSNLSEFRGGATLLETSNKTWLNLLSNSKKFRETQSEEQIQTAIKLAYNLENPSKHNPGTIGCVSCHLAQTVRLWGENHFQQWDFKSIFANEMYSNTKINLTNTSVNPSRTDRMRAFGYFNTEPIISQRVINETAEIILNPL